MPGPLTWSVRGNLRNDETFVSQALAQARRTHPEADSVLFAGTMPDGRRLALVALVSAVPASPVDPAAAVIAVNAPPHQSVRHASIEATNGLYTVNGIVGWAWRAGNTKVYAVLLGRPAPLEAEISAFIDYRADGSATRTWQRVEGPDGVAVVDLGTRVDPAVAVRQGANRPSHVPVLVDVSLPHEPAGHVVVPHVDAVGGLRGRGYAGPGPTTVTSAVAQAVNALVDVTTADLRVLWSGRVDVRRGVLVRVRRAEGAAFHVFVTADEESQEPQMTDVRRVPWRDADVMPWVFYPDPGDPEQTVRVINPSGAGTVTVDLDDARRLSAPTASSGIGTLGQHLSVSDLAGATIRVLSPEGRHVMRGSLPKISEQDVFVLD